MNKTPNRQEIANAFKKGTLANDFAQRFGGLDRPAMNETAILCGAMHNAGEIDLLSLVNEGSLLALSDPLFFMGTYFIDCVLPELDETPERVMACVDKLVKRGGNDGAANQPNAAFREWCKRDPRRCDAVVEAAMTGDSVARTFLVFALEASMDVALAKKIALSKSSEAACHAIMALGKIPAIDDESLVERTAILSQLLTRDPDDNMRASILNAAITLLNQQKQQGKDELLKVVALAAGSSDALTVHHAAQALWLASERLDDITVAALLTSVRHLNPENTRTIQFLDFGLAGLIKNGHVERAIGFVTELVSASGEIRLESFDGFMRAVAENEELLGIIAIRWLQNGSPALCSGLADFLQRDNLRGQPLKIHATGIPSDPRVQTFICRKALGWFFLLPTTAASVLVAVLREVKGEAVKEVQSLIFETLLRNYGGVEDYIATIPLDDPVRKRTEAAQRMHKDYINGIKSVETISELQPCERRKRIYDQRVAEEMKSAHKSAQKQSVFHGLIRHSVLLYGRGAVTYVQDSDQTLRAVETDLKTIGVEMEFPRAETLDPIGLNFQLSLFRTEKMKK